jgi:2-keto-myo-inositol isomerase
MGDVHRVLVDDATGWETFRPDRRASGGGLCRPVSFEAFAPEVHASSDPEGDLRRSMEFIRSRLAAKAA